MSTKFFTNKENNSLLQKFEGIFKNMSNIFFFDALVGYFRASGYFKMREYLLKVPQIRILVGIDVDDIIEKSQTAGLKFFGDKTTTKNEFIEHLKEDIKNADYSKHIENSVLMFVEDIVSGRLKIKAHPTKQLHAKIYIFRPEDFNEHSHSEVITGSSNLTSAGIGGSKDANYEFNVILKDYDDIKFATDEFEQLWNESVDILSTDINRLIPESHLNDTFTPFELYIKLLIEYFGKRIDYNPASVDLLLPKGYMKLNYQGEAALEGYEMMMKYNGFFLSDVVGLGKTIVACIIAKKFILENGYHTRILIVHPPAIEANWKNTINDFGIKGNVEFITTGSLKKITDKDNYEYSQPRAFDLIIIDEAHKFRNDTSEMYKELQIICKAPRRFAGEHDDRKKKIMLLSATPMNNRPEDIKNQLYLFQDPRASTLPKVKDLQRFFKPLEDKYKELKNEEKIDILKIKQIFDIIRDRVIEPIVIRRTRKDIWDNDDYRKDMKEQGIEFPNIIPPFEVKYLFNDELSLLFSDTVSILTNTYDNGKKGYGLEYYRYRAIEFLEDKEAAKNLYGDASGISKRLAAIMKTMLVKRIESSFFAFKNSLLRFQKATQNMINMFDNDNIYVAPDIDVNKFLEDKSEEELEKKIHEKGGNNRIFNASDFEAEFIQLLKEDKEKIDDLVKRWEKIGDYDPKFDKFLSELDTTFLNKKENLDGKLVIFSESKETTSYLKQKLNDNGYSKILEISSDNRKKREKAIKENFDANYDGEHKNNYNIIVTTEVLAEGINLHRSNVIVNYDVPWNSTRLMQRIGRVNRIGTKAKEIYIHNFYPSDDSDNEIKLSDTAIRKLQAFHTAFGEDSQIYSRMEEVGEAGLYGTKLREERNATLMYLQELREFKRKQPDDFKKIQDIPQKARIARDSNNINQTEFSLSDSTITYLKKKDHPGVFYLVDNEKQLSELNFIDAAGIFRADTKEKAVELIEKHYEQVNFAKQMFEETGKQDAVTQVRRIDLSPPAKRVLPKLKAYLNLSDIFADKQILNSAVRAILLKSHKSLAGDIEKFIKQNKSKIDTAYIQRLIKNVILKYNLPMESENDHQQKRVYKPEIIISESFK